MTIHVPVLTWILGQVALIVYLVSWAFNKALEARKRYWQKELSKTIAGKTAAGEPVPVFVDKGKKRGVVIESPGITVEIDHDLTPEEIETFRATLDTNLRGFRA